MAGKWAISPSIFHLQVVYKKNNLLTSNFHFLGVNPSNKKPEKDSNPVPRGDQPKAPT